MMKQLFFVLFMATVVLMLSANEAAAANETVATNVTVPAGACTTTLATASLMGLAFNVLMNFLQ